MDELLHYGTPQNFPGDPHGSGRYREGSGLNPYQHTSDFSSRVNQLKKEGYSEKEIAEMMGMKTTELRSLISISKEQRLAAERSQIIRLKNHGYSNTKIAEIMDMKESTVRNRLKPVLDERQMRITSLADKLKDQVAEKTYLDVGKGVETQLGVSKQSMDAAINLLTNNGYKKHYLKVEQATNPGKFTSVMVLTKNDIDWKQVNKNRDKIMAPDGVYSDDGGNTWSNIQTPLSVSSDRIQIRYSEDGGSQKDGFIELRRGVPDISLGNARYAQVRIAVDDSKYLKGMAAYSDNLPDGVDIIFNTNKSKDIPKMDVLKSMKDDPDNPFGSTIRQLKNEEGKVISACNIVNDDEDWGKWSKTLSSQFLSKQNASLAKRQLDFAYQDRKQEFEDICQLTNPVVKKKLLNSFAEECDSDAVHLKAAALPRQQTQVILPVTSLKDNEVYAPNFKTGEELVLIRHPHGGTFEIPRLIVNNRNKEGKELIGNAPQAIGINSNVAKILSGADFDGDTVIAIPTSGQKIKTSKPLKDLENFDHQELYKAYPGMPKVTKKNFNKQMEMGKISNLITDMTLKGATEAEIARAVKHSMVIIDAEKHNLNYKQSYEDNNIRELKVKYLGGANKGASTLISKAKKEYKVPARKEYIPDRDIDPVTGEKIYRETGESYVDKKTGKTIFRTEKSTWMQEIKDAHDPRINSGTKMEGVYADHANKLKALANEARKEYMRTHSIKTNAAAKKTYSKEVESLNQKLEKSLLNAPKERQAQLLASFIFDAKKRDNPGMEKEEEKKIKSQIIKEARARVGATSRKERNVDISDREWEAIQAGAISQSRLSLIIANTDEQTLKERSMPREQKSISSGTRSRIKARLAQGYSQAEIAESMGVSISTVNKIANE